MKKRVSRLPGFYKDDLATRRERVSGAAKIDVDELRRILDTGGLDPKTADKIVENVLGVHALPFGLGLNVKVNGRDFLVPMVVEEPSVIAAASNAAKMIRAGGGFEAEADAPIMTSQVAVHGVGDVETAKARILDAREELLREANDSVKGLVERGGGARDLEVRILTDEMLVAHLYVDCRDAMGANLVNTVAERVGPKIAELAEGTLGLRILSNLCDRRRVRIRCRVPVDALKTEALSGEEVARGIVQASHFAENDPYRAATHNKGIMNGIDAVVLATCNDWRAVEAGAHAYAARDGRYAPLAIWRTKTASGEAFLEGSLELPLALGIVGGTLRVHAAARLALRLLDVASASELAMVAASVGLASNLAALRALATEGIQRGHMSLHARAVAIAAGAEGDEVEVVAAAIVEAQEITVDAAGRVLRGLRPLASPRGD